MVPLECLSQAIMSIDLPFLAPRKGDLSVCLFFFLRFSPFFFSFSSRETGNRWNVSMPFTLSVPLNLSVMVAPPSISPACTHHMISTSVTSLR